MNYIQQLQHNITTSRRVRAASSFIFHSAAEQSDFSVHAAQLRTHTPAGHVDSLLSRWRCADCHLELFISQPDVAAPECFITAQQFSSHVV